jgi:hypothetical protein
MKRLQQYCCLQLYAGTAEPCNPAAYVLNSRMHTMGSGASHILRLTPYAVITPENEFAIAQTLEHSLSYSWVANFMPMAHHDDQSLISAVRLPCQSAATCPACDTSP